MLNDFDLSADYERLIEGVLEAGVGSTRSGCSAYAPGLPGDEDAGHPDRFSRFGLPLHLTETTLVSGHLMPPEIVDLNDYQVADWPTTPEGEARQADEVEAHYSTLWPTRRSRRSPGGGLPAALAGRARRAGARRRLAKAGLRRAPRTDQGRVVAAADDVRTDDDGRGPGRGFLGDYEVAAADGGAALSLDAPGPIDLTVRLG